MSIRFQPNRRELAAFLKSVEVQGMLAEAGETIARRAGVGFGSQVNVGRDRARATVMAETPEAKVRQARDHALERAVGGGL